jgi:hypothetical protein
MSKKEYFLVGMVVVLAGLYVVFFSNWFKPKFIRVEHAVRSSRDAWAGGQRVMADTKSAGSVTFALHRNYRLTSVRVVRADEIATNKYAHPLWHLVSKAGSTPIEGFAYGFPLQGMTPAVAAAEPEMLERGVEYCLFLEAGSLKGSNVFRIDQVSARR